VGRIELEQFSLAEGVTAEGFRALDEAAQAWCYVHREGLVRRTTALGQDGGVLVVTILSGSAPVPDAAPTGPIDLLAPAVAPATYRWASFVDLG